MAFLPGLKKQINKANQFMSEKISGVEGTKLDDDFHTMERKTDLIVELVDDLQIKTKEYLQPNPTVRAKMAAVKGISKLSGQAKASTYPQPEGTLGEAMSTYGNKLQDFDSESIFAVSLIESGEALKQMADLKYALDDNVKQNYLEPLHQLQSKDLKEVAHHRKKLQGRKLDYDCKKRKQQSGGQVPDKEIKQAEDKFSESLHLAQMGMHNIMENDIEQISQLMQFAEALLEYHRQCTEILQGMTDTLYTKTNSASSRSRREFTPKTLEDLGVEMSNDFQPNPQAERAMRSASSSRSGEQRSSSVARSGSGGGQPRPTSQPNFGVSGVGLTDLDPWESAEARASAPSAPPTSTWPSNINNNGSLAVNKHGQGSGAGWTVFPENSPAPAPRSAWGGTGGVKPPVSSQKPSFSSNNGFSQYSNIPGSGNLISPGGSPAGTPTHHQQSGHSSGFNSASPRPSPVTTPTKLSHPSCQALYDFEPENAGELGFKEGDMITLTQKVDDNWFEGTVGGRSGFFPINYVNVVVPLP
jgi:endophilin-A